MRYPIFHTFMTGESLALCAEFPLNSHTFESPEASLRLILLIIPRLEPRLSHRCTRCSIVASRMYGRYTGRLVVYPGVYREATYPGWCISSIPTREAYTALYTFPYPPGRHIQPCTPYVHPGIPMYTLVYPIYTLGIPPS